MKQALIGFALVALAASLGWLVAFGPTAPCEAMQVEARKLADAKDAKSRRIAHALGGARGAVSPTECIGTAVRLKAFGADGVTVVGPGAPAASSESKGKR